MKKLLYFLLAVCCLSGCMNNGTEPLPPADTVPPAATTQPTEAEETAPLHSPLYIPELEQADVLLYFREVCLDAEFVNGGDPSRLQKWDEPIRYWIFGAPTGKDLVTLDGFSIWLNTLPGFPGIGPAETEAESNLAIHFCPQAEIPQRMGPDFSNMDGAVTFWYENDRIYRGIICVRSDADQELRTSVLLEELYNGLGPVQDTLLRPDSIIFSEYATPQELTEVDRLLLRLLYDPSLVCGMTPEACQEAICKLYY